MEDPTDNLTDLSFKELTARLASREPIPGGGSAAALAGAMGAALVAMVAELTVGKPEAAQIEQVLLDLRDGAIVRQGALLDLGEEDVAAYAAALAARRLPKETDAERQLRAEAMRTTIVNAAEVPLRTAQVAAEVLDLAVRIAPIGNRNAVSDAGVAAQLAGAAVRGALLNVRINLPYLPAGEPLLDTAPGEIARLEAAAAAGEDAALALVSGRIEPS